MSVVKIVFRKVEGHYRKVIVPVRTMEEYLNERNAPQHVSRFHAVRNGNEEEKKNLIQFNYTIYPPEEETPLRGYKIPSDTFCLDIDCASKEESDKYIRTVLDTLELSDVMLVERTAHYGLHVVFKREYGKTILESQVHYARLIGCEMDTNAKDLQRVWYASTNEEDELIYINPMLFELNWDMKKAEAEVDILNNRIKARLDDVPEEARMSNKHYKPRETRDTIDPLPASPRGGEESQYDKRNGGQSEESQHDERNETRNEENRDDERNETRNEEDQHDEQNEGRNEESQHDEQNEGRNEENRDEEQNETQSEKSVAYNSTPRGGREGVLSSPREGVPSYLSIPYSSIISKYWELHNHGMEPVTSNRDMLTFELALNLRHICGFDETLMDKVIPCYDGFPEEQKMKCIRSAINEKRTQMPRKLREVLDALRMEAMSPTAGKDGAQRVSAIDEIDEQNNMYYYDNMPKAVMVQGIKDSIEAAGRVLTMPAVFAACPCIAANATNVELEVHGKFNFLGLNVFIAGEAASNKGQMDDIVRAWCSHQRMMAKMYNKQWIEWRNKMKLAKNKKEQPVEPTLPKEWITLNNTTANLAEELARVEGRHAISFTQEADVVVQKWKQDVSDFSTMLRIAWDASDYDREARSVDAVNVHIERLKWNVVMCGTPDALYRVVGTNGCRDGFQTRLCVAMTPDNTYSRLDDNPAKMTPTQKERIEQVATLLRLMSGRLVLSELEKKGREWLEEVRIHTMMNDDKTMARQRFRICINAQRMTCCLILAAVCDKLIRKHGVQGAENVMKQSPELWMEMAKKMQTQAFLKVFDLIADYLMDTTLYFFRSRIEAGVAADDYNPKGQKNAGSRSRKGKNDTIFGLLGDTFTANDAFMQSAAIKGAGVTQNAVDMMLRNWIRQELVVEKDGRYVKVAVISH